MEDAAYLDVPDTAKRFGVSAGCIYRYIREGKLRTKQAGRRLAVELASAREWFSDAPEVQHILDSHVGNVRRVEASAE
jgi:hypothetical protein